MSLRDFDFTDFWNGEAYESSLIDEEIVLVEKELGYKLPKSYIEMMKLHNGGMLKKNNFPVEEEIWPLTDEEYPNLSLYEFFSIGHGKNVLCGEMGQKLWREEWGYPDYGVYIIDMSSSGHNLIMLDYRKCGKEGEPELALVQEVNDYKVTFLADDFETFVHGLITDPFYDEE